MKKKVITISIVVAIVLLLVGVFAFILVNSQAENRTWAGERAPT